jgi:hypothetical protein
MTAVTTAPKGATVPDKAAPAELPNPVINGDEESIATLLKSGGFLDAPAEIASPDAGAAEATEVAEAAEETPVETAGTETEETVTEAAAETEEQETGTEDEEESEEDDEEVSGLDAKIQAKINKRIGKEVAKRKELEATLETERQAKASAEVRQAELESQLQEAQTSGVSAPTENPLANLTTGAALQAKAEEAENILDWAESNLARLKRNPQAVEAQLKANQVKLADDDYSPEAMEEWLSNVRRNVDKTLRVHLPKQARFLQEKADWDKAAVAEFPFLKDPKSPDFLKAKDVLKTYPELKLRPNWQYVAGLAVEGFKVVEARKAERTKAAATPPAKPAPSKIPPRVPGQRKVAPAAPDPTKAVKAAASKRFQETGSEKDLTAVVATLID